MKKEGSQIKRTFWMNMLYIMLSILFTISCGGGGDGSSNGHGNNSSPVVQITSPTESSNFAVGDEIKLSGSCSDNEDGYLIGSSLVWTSDLDGQLGTGETCISDTLSIGIHNITLTATDSEGAVGMDTVAITVFEFIATGLVPDTGQVTSYTDTYGEDSDYGINPPHYTKLDINGNELEASAANWAMAKDNVTGLIWEVKTDDGGIHDKHNTYTWQDAQDVFITQLNDDNFCGHSDWRLPTVNDLSYLVNADANKPAINTVYFPNTMSFFYWTSMMNHNNADLVWSVGFDHGMVFNTLESNYYHVRAVRGGPSSSNYIDNGDGTVTDMSTGLIWQQDQASPMNWDAALVYCESLVLAGYDDWRLPNRNELQSLLDHTAFNPSIDTILFPNTMSKEYWTSTTAITKPDCPIKYAYCVGFAYGGVGLGHNSDSHYNVRAVRGGQ